MADKFLDDAEAAGLGSPPGESDSGKVLYMRSQSSKGVIPAFSAQFSIFIFLDTIPTPSPWRSRNIPIFCGSGEITDLNARLSQGQQCNLNWANHNTVPP